MMITAEEAANRSEYSNSLSGVKVRISRLIDEATREGKNWVSYKGNIPEGLREELGRYGYELNLETDTYFQIYW